MGAAALEDSIDEMILWLVIYSFSEHSRQHVIRAISSDVREREDNLVDQCVRKATKYMSDGL